MPRASPNTMTPAIRPSGLHAEPAQPGKPLEPNVDVHRIARARNGSPPPCPADDDHYLVHFPDRRPLQLLLVERPTSPQLQRHPLDARRPLDLQRHRDRACRPVVGHLRTQPHQVHAAGTQLVRKPLRPDARGRPTRQLIPQPQDVPTQLRRRPPGSSSAWAAPTLKVPACAASVRRIASSAASAEPPPTECEQHYRQSAASGATRRANLCRSLTTLCSSLAIDKAAAWSHPCSLWRVESVPLIIGRKAGGRNASPSRTRVSSLTRPGSGRYNRRTKNA